MIVKRALFAILGFALLTFSSAQAFLLQPSDSNASRLARGLPLLKPKRLHDPSRTSALKARQSITPLSQVISVALASDPSTVIGYVGHSNDQAFVTAASSAIPVDSPTAYDTEEQAINTDVPDGAVTFSLMCVDSANEVAVGGSTGAAVFLFAHENSDTCVTTSFEFASSDQAVTITFPNPNAGGVVGFPNIYSDPSDGLLFASASAADANAVFGSSLTEADQVLWTYIS
jgi:hypothetical protein